MKTRAQKSTSVVNTSNKSNEKLKRKPLGDKTNNIYTSANKNSAVQGKTDGNIKTRQNTRNVAKLKTKSKPDPKIKLKANKKSLDTVNTSTIIQRRSSKPIKNTNLDKSKSSEVIRRSSSISTESNVSVIKSKRILELQNVSSEQSQSDPYEFKFDPKDEPKRNPKRRRGKPKRYESSDEDSSIKSIIKNTRKKQNITLTPVERKLRNRIVKNPFKEMIVVSSDNSDIQIQKKQTVNVPQTKESVIKTVKVPQIKESVIKTVKVPQTKESEIKTVKVPQTKESVIKTVKIDEKIPQTSEIKVCDKIPEISENVLPEIVVVNPENEVKNVSVVDEINEIANTFMEDDLFDDNSQALISSPSRIDIISDLIARRHNKPKVFNSTMIQETPQIEPKSPWRVELSVIPKKTLNFSVKNTSFTPSYTPDITTSNKKQSTLLDFVSRQSKPNIPITLFQNSPTRKPFANLSNSVSPIKYPSNTSPIKRSNDSLFGFTFLSDSEENKENSPGVKTPRRNKKSHKSPARSPKKQSPAARSPIKTNEVIQDEPPDISIPLFEDLYETKHQEKRYSRQYTRPTKRKRNVSYYIDDSESEEETHHPIKKKQKDVASKEEIEEADRLASHYNSLFEEIENYPLCIE